MASTIVLYPCPLAGHIGAMVEIGKLILNRHPSLSVTVIITTLPSEASSKTAAYLHHISTTTSITFHHLPTVSLLPASIVDMAFELTRLQNPNLRQTLQTISHKSNIKAFIIDFFCSSASQISAELDIPTYFFFTSGASTLSMFLRLPILHETTNQSLKDLDEYINVPGSPRVHAKDYPEPVLDRTNSCYKYIIETAIQMTKSSGIFTNTFEALEPRAVQALSTGEYLPNGPTPPVYHVGPVIASTNDGNSRRSSSSDDCLNWLNSQPSRSVVFLCFGSMGRFGEEQLKEISNGLEKSGHRFLWVVRNPPLADGETVDLVGLLPSGFLDRTKDKGLVVIDWAPQVEILSHDSVGGFVTHCGWNSTLEAVLAGVPMLAWPLYAEQKINAVILAEEVKVALAVKRRGDGFVTAEEVDERVRELMEGESGKVVRNRVLELKVSAEAATQEGGSSSVAFAKLTEPWIMTRSP